MITPPIPFHTITVDFILSLPSTQDGFNTAMSMTDKFTKLIGVLAGYDTWTGEQWAETALAYWWTANWGIPTAIISDRDPKFVQGFWRQLFQLIHTRLLFSAAYHPQTDGQSERSNQTLEVALRYAIATHPGVEWTDHLPALQATLNGSLSVSTGYSPYQLLYGMELRQPWSLLRQSPSPVLAMRADAEHSIAWAAMKMKAQYDRKHRPIHFEPGDQVYLKLGDGYQSQANRVLPTVLAQKYAGRFTILERIGRLAYRLDFPEGSKVHPVVSIAHLEPAP